MRALLAIVLSSFTVLAFAQKGNPGYVVDGSGQVVRTGAGLCVHTSQWTPSMAIEGCDPVTKRPVPVVSVIDSGVLFAFDSAVLTAAGQEALNALIKQIKSGSTVAVVGHTDRIGPAAYNQALSQARAQAVVTYLSSKAKANYTVTGVGSTRPSGKTAQCTGPVNQKLIACLAPDRRVVITIL